MTNETASAERGETQGHKSMTETPLPCPFCGGDAQIMERPQSSKDTGFFCAISCFCGGYSARAQQRGIAETEHAARAKALTAWNTRTPSHHDLVEALREATQIAVYLWREHYRDDAPNWQPLPDLRGVISQIDNMVTGLTKAEAGHG